MALVQGTSEVVLHKTKMCRFYGMGACTKGEACTFAHTRTDLQKQPDLQKTHLCLAFQRNGVCRDGSACKYAHGDDELRKEAAAKHQNISRAPKSQVPPHKATLADIANSFPEMMVPTMPMPADDGFVRQASPSMAAVDEFLKDNKWGDKAIAAETGPALDGTTCYQSTCSPVSDTASTEGGSVEDDSSSQGIIKGQPKPNENLNKTKMCKFYAQGLCRKGTACDFAHDQGALRQQPDLFRTRLCLSFSRSGFCKAGDSCKYAHGVEQLRANTDGNSSPNLEASLAGGANKQKSSRTDALLVDALDDSCSLNLKTWATEPIFMTFENGKVCLHPGTSNM